MSRGLFGFLLAFFSLATSAQSLERFTESSVIYEPTEGRVYYECRLEIGNLAASETFNVRVDAFYRDRNPQLFWETFPLGPNQKSFRTRSPDQYTITANFRNGSITAFARGYWYGSPIAGDYLQCSWLIYTNDVNYPLHAGVSQVFVGVPFQ